MTRLWKHGESPFTFPIAWHFNCSIIIWVFLLNILNDCLKHNGCRVWFYARKTISFPPYKCTHCPYPTTLLYECYNQNNTYSSKTFCCVRSNEMKKKTERRTNAPPRWADPDSLSERCRTHSITCEIASKSFIMLHCSHRPVTIQNYNNLLGKSVIIKLEKR